jgi:phosphoribosylaminoimidazole-succinocarboxamide synthase
MTTAPVLEGLRHQASGKVREIYDVDDAHLLLVTTDRLSAFDVVLEDPIPGRGTVLTALTQFWLERTADLVPNHLVGRPALGTSPAGRCWCAGST